MRESLRLTLAIAQASFVERVLFATAIVGGGSIIWLTIVVAVSLKVFSGTLPQFLGLIVLRQIEFFLIDGLFGLLIGYALGVLTRKWMLGVALTLSLIAVTTNWRLEGKDARFAIPIALAQYPNTTATAVRYGFFDQTGLPPFVVTEIVMLTDDPPESVVSFYEQRYRDLGIYTEVRFIDTGPGQFRICGEQKMFSTKPTGAQLRLFVESRESQVEKTRVGYDSRSHRGLAERISAWFGSRSRERFTSVAIIPINGKQCINIRKTDT